LPLGVGDALAAPFLNLCQLLAQRLMALVTICSSSGTDREGSSAANRSATALARSSGGDTEKRY